ncbi:hypothetical protein RM153_21540 (plasmid) [Pantoea agglomerans]|uniref:DUF6575 domain-containing protein n=1 Tax=Enterobacter agglomerans TaxID=549 RepID=UPI00289A9EC9|nr:DUF6575 domain-containing protein [Pantoea agglomerans]WNK51275.1 hypothetical protein RM153_21540 [Pantoea agglomerans]
MDDIFISHPFLGKLKFINVYIEYDGPRVFSLESETGASYISYWVGDDNKCEKWFLIPCSKTRVYAFEKNQIDLKSLISQQEQDNFYKVEILFETDEVEITPQEAKNIFEIKLPERGVYADHVKIYSSSLVEANLVATHEVKLAKSNEDKKSNVLLEHLATVCDSFCDLAKQFSFSRKTRGTSIQALNARYGSFAISLHAEKLDPFESVISDIADMMHSGNDIMPYLLKNDIDIKAFGDFLNSIAITSVNFEFKALHNKDRVVSIYKHEALKYRRTLSEMSLQYISSIRVPQANDIDKVFKIIELTWDGEIINDRALKVDKRHVGYYKQAARILDLLRNDGTLTSLGQKIARADSYERRMSITAKAFEESECGWAWINWSNVDSLKDVDPLTANSFLTERCPSLTGTTVGRRADTLSAWYIKLMPYYVGYLKS